MIPDKSNPTWKSLIEGQNKVQIKSFSLQMKINSLQKMTSAGLIRMPDAIDELHELCVKYEKIYSDDLRVVFNNNLNS